MEVPEIYKGKKLVKCYPNFALYENNGFRECFNYYELGQETKQIKEKKVRVNMYL